MGTINEMMTEISTFIKRNKGFSKRYMQGHINFNILRKQLKYQYKRKEMVIETKSFKNVFVTQTPIPISLKNAYFEYRYVIFAEENT